MQCGVAILQAGPECSAIILWVQIRQRSPIHARSEPERGQIELELGGESKRNCTVIASNVVSDAVASRWVVMHKR